MHYLGSKARHAREIIAITTANRRDDQIYVEPFVGGGNVINKVPQGAGRIANDKNEGMVALLDCLGNRGWIPPETMTEKEWRKIMKLKMPELDWEGKALFAFAATGPTFGSMWCGQWAKDYEGKEGTRYRQARDAALNDAPGLAGIEFHSGSYADLTIPDGSIVYCDPPYYGTTGYSGSAKAIPVGESLNANTWKQAPFWRWCDNLVDNHGCSVFVSEYQGAPSSTYPALPSAEQKERRREAAAHATALADDTKATNDEIIAAQNIVFAIDAEIKANADVLAARWKVLWEKEVVSDFSASRGKGDEENAGKRETEKLFSRQG